MARMAHERYDADWVINCDADEFWYPRFGDLKDIFNSVDDDVNVIKVQRQNFICIDTEESLFYLNMIYREKQSNP